MARRLLWFATLGATVAVTAVACIWLVRAVDARSMPELEVWHEFRPTAEFRAANYPDGITLAEYRDIETALAEEIDAQVFAAVAEHGDHPLSRYDRSSLVYPDPDEARYNRSFELAPAEPSAAILLIHGASDSPYSMRALADRFYRNGYHVLVLRLPGNGTVPGGLADVRMDDWVAITEMGVRHLDGQFGDRLPLYVGGYSIGAPLALHYSLGALNDATRRLPDGLLLYSPAIAVSSYARFASWDVALSKLPMFHQFAWVTIEPEYDPFKYNSFAKNAGDLAYRLTKAVQSGMAALGDNPARGRFPPVIAFQSLVDATVSTEAAIEHVFRHLPDNGSALVLFDMNREHHLKFVLRDTHADTIDRLLSGPPLHFHISLVTNESGDSSRLGVTTRAAGEHSLTQTPLPFRWPAGVFSLSHVALPFEPGDPWYGPGGEGKPAHRLAPGSISPRGEKDVLRANLQTLMRMRYNPFFDYVVNRSLRFTTDAEDI